MHISLNISDELVNKAQSLYPNKSIQEIIEEALSFYIASHQNQLSKFRGSIEIEPEI